jgi:hypothetical protein
MLYAIIEATIVRRILHCDFRGNHCEMLMYNHRAVYSEVKFMLSHRGNYLRPVSLHYPKDNCCELRIMVSPSRVITMIIMEMFSYHHQCKYSKIKVFDAITVETMVKLPLQCHYTPMKQNLRQS